MRMERTCRMMRIIRWIQKERKREKKKRMSLIPRGDLTVVVTVVRVTSLIRFTALMKMLSVLEDDEDVDDCVTVRMTLLTMSLLHAARQEASSMFFSSVR